MLNLLRKLCGIVIEPTEAERHNKTISDNQWVVIQAQIDHAVKNSISNYFYTEHLTETNKKKLKQKGYQITDGYNKGWRVWF